MMYKATTLSVLLAATPAFAQRATTPTPEVAAEIVQTDVYPVPRVQFPGGVRGLPAVAYWTPGGFRPLTLDLYLPAMSVQRPRAGFPLIIYIHGGGWSGGDSHNSGAFVDFPAVLASIAARGYVVASINYRLSGEARYPAQAQDVKAAIRFLRLHARQYGIDPTRVVVWGVSTGGHLAAIATVTCGVVELAPKLAIISNSEIKPDEIVNARVSDCVQGAVVWFGVFDMATIADQAREADALSRDAPGAPEWGLLGCMRRQCTTELIRLASPVSFVKRTTPPMLLITGDKDTVVPYQQSAQMAARLKAVGARYELIVIPNVDHSLIGRTQQQTRDAHLKALSETVRFIEKTVAPR